MKKFTVLLVTLALTGIARSEDAKPNGPQPALDTNSMQVVLSNDKRAVFEKAMGLTGKDKDKFFKLYGKYEKESAGLNKKSLELLNKYVAEHDKMSTRQNSRYLDDLGRVQEDSLRLRQKYARKIGNKLSEKVGVLFYQIDDYIQSTTRLGLLNNIPLVGEKIVVTPQTAPGVPAAVNEPATK